MSPEAYEVARVDELERVSGELVTVPVRIPLGISAFGVNAYEATEAGGTVVEEHDELGSGAGGHEELYVVLRGRATFTVAGDEIDARAGTFVFVRDPAARRAALAVDAGTTVLVVGGVPGQAFEPSPWESWLEAGPSYRAQDYDGAARVLAAALERHPDNPNVLYNLACCEALAGRRQEALAHLARAIEGDPRCRAWAKDDDDLDAIRDDPAFPAA